MSNPMIYGWHAVDALFNNPHREITQLILARDNARSQELADKAASKKIPITWLTTVQMTKHCEQHDIDQINHQGVIAYATPLPNYNENHLVQLLNASQKPPLILILDGITDPHNLGACLRSADAVGVDFVIVPKDKSASVTPVVSKVASGAAEAVPFVRVTNLVRTLEWLKQQGVWIYGAAGEAAQTIYQVDLSAPIAVVLGAEGSGLRRLTRVHCDGLFSLPMVGTVKSLNVSVATGIVLYEVKRQRNV